MDYYAITIDTCIFENHGLSLEKGLLAQLEQFSASQFKFILSDVVYNELRKHLIDKNKTSRTSVNHAIKAASNCHLINDDALESVKKIFADCKEDDKNADDRLENFVRKTSLEIISSADFVDITRLIEMYFSSSLPFEPSGAKKSEFPDALALLAIESWAENNNVKVLAVSTDKGWAGFAENSNFITVVEGLADALAHFQTHSFADRIVNRLQLLFTEDNTHHLIVEIEDAIVSSVEEADDITIEATSRFYYEEEETYATHIEHTFALDEAGNVKINVVRDSDDTLVLQLKAEVTCEVNCYFSLSVFDSIDKDYVSMGGVNANTEENYSTSILLYITGDFRNGLDGIELSKVEVLKTVRKAYFGDIEPDWGNEDPERGED